MLTDLHGEGDAKKNASFLLVFPRAAHCCKEAEYDEKIPNRGRALHRKAIDAALRRKQCHRKRHPHVCLPQFPRN